VRVVPLEVERGFLTEAGVAPMRVVPALDEVEDGHSGLGLVTEAVLLEELVGAGGFLEDLTKRLYERALEGELTSHLGYIIATDATETDAL